MKTNTLYPIFLKTENFTTLIVGGGKVGHEKLHFLLKSSPRAKVKIVSEIFSNEILTLASGFETVKVVKKAYHEDYLDDAGLVIAATDDRNVNRKIYDDAVKRNLLVNVADTPELCHFYLGGIVTKGDLKIGISTNGRSPVLAKRLRGFFEHALPDNLDLLLENLDAVRRKIGRDLKKRTAILNELTRDYLDN